MADAAWAAELERRVESLGFEVVELERAGNRLRPVIRLRIDRDGGSPEAGVSVDDCGTVSRALESWLDQREDLATRYVLEVSTPGVERPLRRPRDWRRFAGEDVVVQGGTALENRRMEGRLLDVSGAEGAEKASLRLDDGSPATFPLADVRHAHLRFRWGKEKRGKRR